MVATGYQERPSHSRVRETFAKTCLRTRYEEPIKVGERFCTAVQLQAHGVDSLISEL